MVISLTQTNITACFKQLSPTVITCIYSPPPTTPPVANTHRNSPSYPTKKPKIINPNRKNVLLLHLRQLLQEIQQLRSPLATHRLRHPQPNIHLQRLQPVLRQRLRTPRALPELKETQPPLQGLQQEVRHPGLAPAAFPAHRRA